MKLVVRRPVGFVFLALALVSCASSGKAGVRVDTIQADIVFGVKEATPGEVAAPDTPTYSGVSTTGAATAPPPLRVPGDDGVGFEVPTSAVEGSCPQAPIGSAPEAAAAENASVPPVAGLYRYKISGSQKIVANGIELTSDLTGFEPRLVRKVQRTSDTFWTYEVVTPSSSGGTDVTTWSVNTNALQRTASPTVAKEITVGEPARGIALAGLDSFDGNGNTIASFRPSPAILMLPLPVLSGASYNGAGIDPKTGQTMQVSGTVQHRQTVDACGTLVDGWLTHLDIQQTVDGATVTRSEDSVFSNDMGGLLISQHITETLTAASGSRTIDVTYSLGQTTPSPFPAGAA